MTSAYAWERLGSADAAVARTRHVVAQDAVARCTHRSAARDVPRRAYRVGTPRPVQVNRIVPPVELPVAGGARRRHRRRRIVPNVLRQLSGHINRPLCARRPHRRRPFFDLHYAELMRDPIGVMRSLYEWAGDDLDAVDRAGDARLADRTSAGPLRCCSRTRWMVPGLRVADLEPVFDEYLSSSTSNWKATHVRAAVTTERAWLRRCRGTRSDTWADEVVIRVTACGVCGSDLKALPYMPAGMIMGHELGGEIVASRIGRRRLAKGTNVGSAAGCFVWVAVVTARPVWSPHCRQTRYIGMGPDGGGFAEFAGVPSRHAFALPDGLPDRLRRPGRAVRGRTTRYPQR